MAAQQQQCSYCGKSMIEWHKPAYSSQIGHITNHYEKSSWMVCQWLCPKKGSQQKVGGYGVLSISYLGWTDVILI